MPDDVVDNNLEADGLTAGERAYLDSGGQNADALLAEQNGAVVEPPKADVAAKVDDPAAKVDAKADAKADAKVDPKTATKADATAAVVDAKAAAADDDDEPTDPKATVPYQQFARERKKLRDQIAALQKSKSDEVAALNERFARGDERLRLLQEALQPAAQTDQADEDPKPDPKEDIVAYVEWADRQIAKLSDAISQTQGTVQETAADQRMRESYQQDAVAFAREKSDFINAYNYLLNARGRMLSYGGKRTQAQVAQILRTEEKGMVREALETGQRPAEVIYEYAKAMGYGIAPAGGQNADAPGGVSTNGVTSAPAGGSSGNGAAAPTAGNGATNGAAQPAAAAKPSVVEEIARIQQGQAAGKSLSDTGGGANELTVEALAAMSENEFNALYAAKKGQIDSLLGKRH